MDHKQWLDNEYAQWEDAIALSSVHDFKMKPEVQRMLGEVTRELFPDSKLGSLILEIDNIGNPNKQAGCSGVALRMVYYARKVIEVIQTEDIVVEIGGGSGQFYATLCALGYKGKYYCYDLPRVLDFQSRYRKVVEQKTGLSLPVGEWINDEDLEWSFCVSLYALGEFEDKAKEYYFETVVNKCKYGGLIAWNPHSGASDDLSLFIHDIKVTPGIEEGVRIIQW